MTPATMRLGAGQGALRQNLLVGATRKVYLSVGVWEARTLVQRTDMNTSGRLRSMCASFCSHATSTRTLELVGPKSSASSRLCKRSVCFMCACASSIRGCSRRRRTRQTRPPMLP
eukprot:Rmarinus@m.20841